MIPAALSLVLRGNLDLDEYRETCAQVNYACSDINGHLWNDFPIGSSLIAAGPLALFEIFTRAVEPALRAVPSLSAQLDRWRSHAHVTGVIDIHFFDVAENIIASLCVAIAVGFFHAAIRRRLSATEISSSHTAIQTMTLTGIFAFGTSAWSTASRVLWQHGPALMFGAMAMYLLMKKERRYWPFCLGLALAAGWVCRPPMAIFAAAVLVWSALERPRALVPIGLGMSLVMGAFVAFNVSALGMPLPPYFQSSRLELFAPFWFEAMAGQMVSPSRGVLIFSPIFLAVPWSLWLAFKNKAPWWKVDVFVAGWLVAHWVVISSFHHWWGGHSYGPRLWTETALGWVWLLSSLFRAASSTVSKRMVLSLSLLSVMIHAHGALSFAPWRWNDFPVGVDENPERLWDWSDPQALRWRFPSSS